MHYKTVHDHSSNITLHSFIFAVVYNENSLNIL